MRARGWNAFALAVLGLVAAGVDVGLVGASDHTSATAATGALQVAVGLGFVTAGAVARWRRPANRTGTLLAVAGFLWFGGTLTAANDAWLFSAGFLLGLGVIGGLVHLLLAFPTGRLRTRRRRALVVTVYGLGFGNTLTQLLLIPRPSGRAQDPRSALLLFDQPTAAAVLDVAFALAGVAVLLLVLRELVSGWRAAGRSQRQSLAPVLWTGAVVLGALALTVALQSAGVTDAASAATVWIASGAVMVLPYAFLGGLLRARYSRASALDALVTTLAGAADRQNLRDGLAAALGDPGLDLVFHRADRDEWVDADGRRYLLPGPEDPERTVTVVERDGAPIGALVHEAALAEEPELLGTAAAAASLALENDRLAAELRARIAELEDSRAKVVAGALAERRRLERDLHDGAQQRLVALALQLGLARARVATDPEGAKALLGTAGDELRLALEELRELARGIHPAVLTDRGLHAAVEALADRFPMPVEVRGFAECGPRFPVAVEAAAYFVIAEALTNVAKYSGARHASVLLARRDGDAVVEVADDGRGGARPEGGSGLAGLVDRLEALDGRLTVESPAGAGTLIRAEIPCAS